jgi:hypothetical protein
MKITDVPNVDTGGGEVTIKGYVIWTRPPGSVNFYKVEPQYGGWIKAGKLRLETIVYVKRWFDDHLALLQEKEGNPLHSDGTWVFSVSALELNGNSSPLADPTTVVVSIRPPAQPGQLVVTPFPQSIGDPAGPGTLEATAVS